MMAAFAIKSPFKAGWFHSNVITERHPQVTQYPGQNLPYMLDWISSNQHTGELS